MLRIKKVSYCTRQGKKLLDGIDCEIRPGELTVLLGPNGAGKSTLLRVLSGERAPHEGRVFFNGIDVHNLSPRELALRRAVLGQQYAVGLPFTCREVVMMGRYSHYRDRNGSDRAIVDAALSAVDSSHLSERLFNTLSGGEQQRVQLARVLVQLEGGERTVAKFLLLDEPTASMDYLHQHLCLRQARELCRSGLIVVLVLHDLNLAAQLADRLLVMKDGRLVATGTPRALLGVEFIREVYGVETKIFYPEPGGAPVVITNLQSC